MGLTFSADEIARVNLVGSCSAKGPTSTIQSEQQFPTLKPERKRAYAVMSDRICKFPPLQRIKCGLSFLLYFVEQHIR